MTQMRRMDSRMRPRSIRDYPGFGRSTLAAELNFVFERHTLEIRHKKLDAHEPFARARNSHTDSPASIRIECRGTFDLLDTSVGQAEPQHDFLHRERLEISGRH